MATQKTVKKILDENWSKLKMEEKTYALTNYNFLQTRKNSRTIQAESSYVVSIVTLIAGIKFLLNYIEFGNVLQTGMTHLMLGKLFMFMAFVFLIFSLISTFSKKDEEKQQELEDWITDTVKKRK